jgi:protein-tyrosine phosphatase/membrane-associated phospholipid phosphatase
MNSAPELSMAASDGTPVRPWRRGLAWLAFLAPFFFITYGLANHWAASRGDVPAIVFAWERLIPFWAWTIVPYWSIDLLYGASLVLARNVRELDGHAKRLLFAQVVSIACFVLFPLRFTFERPNTDGVFGWLFDVLLGFDKPFNQAPSLHISLLVILWSFYARRIGGIAAWLMHGWALLIGFSVLTTYQHHFIDIPTGALVGALAVMAFPLDAAEAEVIQRSPRRHQLALAYLGAALLLAQGGLWWGGVGLWLLWPAAALIWVAGIYWVGQPHLFRLRGAQRSLAAKVLLWPYLTGAWLNSRLWTWRQPQPREIVPGLWLSRFPSAAELARLQAQAAASFCAELSLHWPAGWVAEVPMLDLLPPEPDQLQAGVLAIASGMRQGRCVAFCALGYSRSASAVAAWLIHARHVDSVNEAVAWVQRCQPLVVFSDAHLIHLRTWHAHQG